MRAAAHLDEPGLGGKYLELCCNQLKLLRNGACRTQLVKRITGAYEFSHHDVVETAQSAAVLQHSLAITLGSVVP